MTSGKLAEGVVHNLERMFSHSGSGELQKHRRQAKQPQCVRDGGFSAKKRLNGGWRQRRLQGNDCTQIKLINLGEILLQWTCSNDLRVQLLHFSLRSEAERYVLV